MFFSYFRLLRLDQWLKNLMLFIPAFFAASLHFDSNALILILAFFAFSLGASSIYIFNDLRDIDFDRQHPRKKSRPIASGEIGINQARILSAILMFTSLVFAYLIQESFAMILGLYIFINLLYSLQLKSIPILDLLILSSGFLLRIYAGGELIDVPISKWLFLMVFLLSFFVGLAKRRDDLLILETTGKKMRKAVNGYSKIFIDYSMVIIASAIVISYIMYTLSEEVVARIGNDFLHWSAIFVVIGILRYMQLTWVENKTGAPVKVLLSDRFLLFIILGWLMFFAYCLYL